MSVNTGYTGTITLSRSLTVTGALTISAGTYNPNAQTTTAGSITVESGGSINAGSTAITLTTNSIDIQGSITSTGALTIQPQTASATMGIGDGASGTFNLTNAELDRLTNGFSAITIGLTTGTGAVDIRSYTFKDNITIRAQGTGGSVTLNGAIATGTAAGETGTISLNAGDGASGILTLASGSSVNAGAQAITLNGDTMDIQGTVTGTSSLTIQPDVASATIGIGDGASGTLNLTNAELDKLTNGFSSITIGFSTTGTGAIDVRTYTFKDAVTINAKGVGGNVTVNGAIATGTATGETGNITLRAAGTTTVASNASINAGEAAIAFGGSGNVDLQGTQTLTGNSVSLNANDTVTIYGDLTVTGSLTIAEGTFNTNGYKTTLQGLTTLSGGVYLSSTALQTFASGLTISGGTFTGSSGDVDINGTFTQTGGTFNAPSGSMMVSGDWSRSGGTFNHNSATVYLDGEDQTISGSTTFNNLFKTDNPDKTLTFPAGNTQTILGVLRLHGAPAKPLLLRSSADGIQWNIDPQGTRDLQFLDIKDSFNSNAIPLSCLTGCIYSGNNTNWELTRRGGGVTAGIFQAPQGPFGIIIEEGASHTQHRNVRLLLQAGSNVNRMAISHFPDFRDAGIEPYVGIKEWMLSEREGMKTVYVKFYTRFGQVSTVYSASILYSPVPASLLPASVISMPFNIPPLLWSFLPEFLSSKFVAGETSLSNKDLSKNTPPEMEFREGRSETLQKEDPHIIDTTGGRQYEQKPSQILKSQRASANSSLETVYDWAKNIHWSIFAVISLLIIVLLLS